MLLPVVCVFNGRRIHVRRREDTCEEEGGYM
jgi:hypothetical protein